MSLRDLLLGSVLSISLMMGTAVAQQSVGTAGTAGGTTGQGIATGAPTSLLNGQGGLSQGLQDRAPDAQIFSGTQLEGTNLFIEEQGGGAATATPSPMNAAGTLLDDGAGGGLLVDRPSPFAAATPVPPLSGTSVQALSGNVDTGLASGAALSGTGAALAQGSRTNLAAGGLLSRRAVSSGQLQQGLRQPSPQIVVLSGSVLRGQAGAPNVIVLPGGAANAVQPRGLTRSVGQSQAVLRGTTEAPNVIALAPASGDVLVVQGSGVPTARRTEDSQGRLRAQIVEVPAE